MNGSRSKKAFEHPLPKLEGLSLDDPLILTEIGGVMLWPLDPLSRERAIAAKKYDYMKNSPIGFSQVPKDDLDAFIKGIVDAYPLQHFND